VAGDGGPGQVEEDDTEREQQEGGEQPAATEGGHLSPASH